MIICTYCAECSRKRVFSILHVPDAEIRGPDFLWIKRRGSLLIDELAPAHRNRGALEVLRNFYPDNALARSIPCIELMREEIALRIDKPDIRSIGIGILILKAAGHTLPDLNKHREVYERRLVSRVNRNFSVITERI